LAERDRLVLALCREAGIPAAITMAGGYARRIDDIVDIQFQTVVIAAEKRTAFLQLSTQKHVSYNENRTEADYS
jgi:hypothetical protein